MKEPLLKKQKGIALVYAIVIMMITSIIMTSVITFIANQTKLSLQNHAKEQAFQIAESGIQYYKWYLAHQTEGKTIAQIDTFWAGGSAYGVTTPYEVEYKDPSGSAVGKFRLTVAAPTAGSSAVNVTAVGWTYKYPTVTRTIAVRFRRPAWSEYAVLSNNDIYYDATTEIFGKVHSNYGVRIDGLAYNLVTSSLSTYDDPEHTGADEFGVHTHKTTTDPLPPAAVPNRPDVFVGGRKFPVDVVDYTGISADLSYMKAQAQAGTNGSRYFGAAHNGQHIVLKTNDTFDIRTVKNFHSQSNEINQYQGSWANYPLPDNGVIFVEDNIWLEGSITSRRVTVAAGNLQSSVKKNIYIGKDIRYTNYDCTEMIGIIGQDNIEITRDSNDVLRIDGVLLTQSGRVGRINYSGSGALKDTITLYGALATNLKPQLSWSTSSGYQHQYFYYDNNLLYCPPPYFPAKTQYEFDLWREQ
jgi:competence protein ComGC